MARQQTRLKKILVTLLLAATAPFATAHAQGFSSVSSGAPKTTITVPPGVGTGSASTPVTAGIPPAVDAPSASSLIATPASVGVVPILASAVPPPPAFGGNLPAAATAVPAQPAPAGTVSPAMPPPAAAVPAPVAPVSAVSSTFSSGSGSFSSVSGSAPSLPSPPPAAANFGAGSSSFEMAEKVVVIKHERKLRLLRRGRVIAEYPIKLGLNPYGHKQREGDFRTPEGKYELVTRNPQSDFFLSIRISYPNREDAAVANENGYEPGGLIMIHGQPNVPKRPLEHYATRDWTDGCIALSNADMVDVWLRTTPGIPIEIRP
jgi:hypothetical protein